MIKIRDEREKEKDVFETELALKERIRGEFEKINHKLLIEIKEVKTMLKVPRLHYKEIEKHDYQALKTQLSTYGNRENDMLAAINTKKAIRLEEIIKKTEQRHPSTSIPAAR